SEESIGIVGYGGHAREVASYLNGAAAFYAVDKAYLREGLVDVERPSLEEQSRSVVIAVGSPMLRKEMVDRWPGNMYANAISDRSYINPDATLGDGLQIAPNAVVMPGCKLGDHVIVN